MSSRNVLAVVLFLLFAAGAGFFCVLSAEKDTVACGRTLLSAGNGLIALKAVEGKISITVDSEKKNRALMQAMKDFQAIDKLKKIAEPFNPGGPFDWIASHPEPGQSVDAYIRGRPVRPSGKMTTGYILPLGKFSEKQREVLTLTAEHLELCYRMPVKVMETESLDIIPDSARRVHPAWKVKQILAPYVLDKVLLPRLPDDAIFFMAVTTSDLYPAPDWNFVYGQANLRLRVGVSSMYRKGNPDRGEKAFRRCLRKMIKTVAHEAGHMFTMAHCISYECLMCGSNNDAESDRHPVSLCPECLKKVRYCIGFDVVKRYRKLNEFYKKTGLEKPAGYTEKAIRILEKAGLKEKKKNMKTPGNSLIADTGSENSRRR